MSGFIVLMDGRAWAGANWAYDAAIRVIAHALSDSKDGAILAAWLLEQTSEAQGPGLGGVDLRELTVSNQALFIHAARQAFIDLQSQDGRNWHDPAAFSSWRERFAILPRLIESIERGEPASTFNPHMSDVIRPTGNKSGPGWDNP